MGIAFDQVGERVGQQRRPAQLLGEGFETRSHVNRGTEDREVEPGTRPDFAVHDVSDVDADTVVQRRTTGLAVLFVQGNHGLTGHGTQQICAGRWLLIACLDVDNGVTLPQMGSGTLLSFLRLP